MSNENKTTSEYDAFSVVQNAQVLEFNEYNEGEFDEYEDDLDTLDSVLESDKFVFLFQRGEKKAKLTCRRLAPSEVAMIDSTIISPELLSQLVKTKKPEDMEDDEIAELTDDLADGAFEKMCRAVHMSITNNTKPSLDRVMQWDASILDTIYKKIMPKGVTTSVDLFPKVADTESDTSTDTE